MRTRSASAIARSLKICSLLPSATEILYSLDLGNQVVAVTHECDYPPEAQSKPRITENVIDHERLTYLYQGRRFRLTDVSGKVVSALVA